MSCHLNKSIIFFALIHLLLWGGGCWSDFSDVKTGMVILISGGTIFTATSVPISYNITYAKGALSQTTSCGIGIVGFNTYLTNDFSVNSTILNFQVSTMQITAQAFDDTIVIYFSINYIAVGKNANFVEVQFACFLPGVLSSGNNTRTETRTAVSLFVNKTLQSNVYLSGFRVHNSIGLTNYLAATVSSTASSSALNFVFTTNQNNTVSSICYTTVIFCQICTQDVYYNWGETGQNVYTNTTAPSNAGIKSRFEGVNRMFFGMSAFSVTRSTARLFEMDTASTYNNIGNNYQSNYGTYGVTIDNFFIAVRGCNISNQEWFVVTDQSCANDNSCPANTAYTLNATARFCQVCYYTCFKCTKGAMEQNCTQCDNTTYRYLDTTANTCPCSIGYIDIGIMLCYPCSYYMPGCYSCLTTTLCQICSPGFVLMPNGQCQCSAGFLVTAVCTNITGCTSAINLGGTVFCLACNSSLFLNRTSSFSCSCMNGFQFNSLLTCINVCGDSKVVSGETCDDGNTVGGDGCSSVCSIESNWTCDNSVSPSKCYIATNISGKLKYVRRVLSGNTAEFAIQLSPQITNFNYINFKSYLTMSVPCSQVNVTYQTPNLIINCQYNQTIEGNLYSVSLSFDPAFFNNSAMTITLPTSGMNAKLTYDSNYQMTFPLQIVVIILDVLAILVFFGSCISERMIGVELLQTLQSVLFTMALMKTCPSSLSPLQELVYSNGYNSIGGVDYTRTYPQTFAVSSVGIEKEFLLSFNLTYIMLLAVSVMCLVLKLVLIYQNKMLEKNMEVEGRSMDIAELFPSNQNVSKVFKFTFERIFFLLAFGSMFLIIFGTAIQLSDQSADYIVLPKQFNLLACGVAIAVVVTFLAMVIVNAVYPASSIFPIFMSKLYLLYYAVYESTFIMVLSFVYTQTWMVYLMIGLVGGNTIFLAIYRPYQEKINNFTIIFNQATILVALGAYLYEELTPKQQNNETLFSILVIVIPVMLFICIVLALYRVYSFYQFMKEERLSYDDQTADKPYVELKTRRTKPESIYETKPNSHRKMSGISGKNQVSGVSGKNQVSGVGGKNEFSMKNEPYYKEIKNSSSKTPISKDDSFIRIPIHKKDELNETKNFNDSIHNPNAIQDYDTFNANKQNNTPNQQIRQDYIDHQNVLSVDQQGNYSDLHYKPKTEEDYDALKIIKARLRKDFYHKVHGTDFTPAEVDIEMQNQEFQGQNEIDQEI